MGDKKPSGIFGLFKRIKTEYVILAVLAIIAVIVFFGVSGATSAKSSETASTVEEYVDTLETKLKNCLSKVKGAGKVDVIISVSSSMQTVFAMQTITSGGGSGETPIIVSGKPVVLKEAYPEISGVLVVAEGANNLTVKVDLLNACQTFLSVTEDKVRILSMK